MSKKWIISDLHLGHKNILNFSGPLRGGMNSEEHDQWLIDQINSTVKKGDLLYVCGDAAFDRESLQKVKKIKGQKILVRGNHDILSTQDYLEHFQQVYGLVSFKGTFWISHAPIHPQELRDRYNIHGHVHQHSVLDANGKPDPRYINACVEMTYGVPQSLDDLLEKHKEEVHRNKLARRAEENKMESNTATVSTEQTDVLKMEYFELPQTDTTIRFLYRFTAPVKTIWTEGTLSLDAALNDVDTGLKEFGLAAFKSLIPKEIANESPEYAHWANLSDVELIECEMVHR